MKRKRRVRRRKPREKTQEKQTRLPPLRAPKGTRLRLDPDWPPVAKPDDILE